MKKEVVFSGIQPTGNFHIGNYLGAVQNWVKLQDCGDYDCYFFIVDYHALTGNATATERRDQIITTAAELLAAGIDPKKSTFFVQSAVPEHTELAWIFNTITPMAELERMTQFKDKAGDQNKKNTNVGLFTYPILMAADILLYKGNFVPVGQDQIQHLELTRNIARWFNKRYGSGKGKEEDFFPEPKPLLTEVPKVMSLLEPDKKMSKSKGLGHVIELADDLKTIENKIKKAVTASTGGEGSKGVENLLLLQKHFGSKELYQKFLKEEKDGTIKYGELKQSVSSSLANYFAEFRKKRAVLLSNPGKLAKQLAVGAKKAGAVARVNMEEVRRLIGIR